MVETPLTPERRLLLVSSSKKHGTDYLDYCSTMMRNALTSRVSRVLFVPHAFHDRDAYATKVRNRFAQDDLGCEVDSLHEATDPIRAVEDAEAIFVEGGNTFRLLKWLYQLEVMDTIRRKVLEEGMPYLSASAGSNLAGPTIRTTNDMPIVEPPSLDALNLVPFEINPHYLDPDPSLTHQGETREERLLGFHQEIENSTPMIALREGGMLMIRGNIMEIFGEPPENSPSSFPARLFRQEDLHSGQWGRDVKGGDLWAFLSRYSTV